MRDIIYAWFVDMITSFQRFKDNDSNYEILLVGKDDLGFFTKVSNPPKLPTIAYRLYRLYYDRYTCVISCYYGKVTIYGTITTLSNYSIYRCMMMVYHIYTHIYI